MVSKEETKKIEPPTCGNLYLAEYLFDSETKYASVYLNRGSAGVGWDKNINQLVRDIAFHITGDLIPKVINGLPCPSFIYDNWLKREAETCWISMAGFQDIEEVIQLHHQTQKRLKVLQITTPLSDKSLDLLLEATNKGADGIYSCKDKIIEIYTKLKGGKE